MQIFKDDTGTPRSLPMTDENGNPVYNPEAEAARAELIEKLCAMPPIMSALDALLEHFGHDTVAEVTARTKRLITASDGRPKLASRSAPTTQAAAAAFPPGHQPTLTSPHRGRRARRYHTPTATRTRRRR